MRVRIVIGALALLLPLVLGGVSQAGLTFTDGNGNDPPGVDFGWTDSFVEKSFGSNGGFTCDFFDGKNTFQLPCFKGEDCWFLCDSFWFDINCDKFGNCFVKCTAETPEPTTLVIWSVLGGLGIGMACWRRRKVA